MKIGDQFSLKFQASPKIQQGFVEIFRDRNPLHVDEKFAQKFGFEREVMHGNILNGFLSYFVGECLPIKEVILCSQEIRYKNPVYPNDVLEFQASITHVSEAAKLIEFKFDFFKGKSKKVATGKLEIMRLI